MSVSFKHWRITFIKGAGSPGTLLFNTIKLNDAGGADLTQTVGGTATASGYYFLYPPSQAVDGNDGTIWTVDGSTGGFTAWFNFEFPTAQAVHDVFVSTYGNEFKWPEWVTVEGSNDGAVYAPITGWQPTGFSTGSSAYQTFDMVIPSTALAPAGTQAAVWQRESVDGYPPAGPPGRSVDQPQRWNLTTGAHSVSGEVDLKGTPNIPVRRKVRIHRQDTGDLAAEVWSDAVTGHFQFDYLAMRDYYLVTFDHTHDKNAVVKDRVQPV